MKIIYLIPESGYVTELRSDTLWGLLCWGIRHLWGEPELEQFIERAKTRQPDFVVSSAFPFKQHGTERIPFFPNPLRIAPALTEQSDQQAARREARARKKLKNVEWLNQEDFEATLSGKLTAIMLFQRVSDLEEIKEEAKKDHMDFIPSGQTVRRTPPEISVHSQTHNTIDRLQGGTLDAIDNDGNPSGQLYHANENFWHDPDNDMDGEGKANTGLFFLAEGPDLSKIEPVLELFRHLGFGADRTSGKGFFNFQIEDFTLTEPTAAESNALLNLSLFHPTRTELEALEKTEGCLQYELEKREGWVGGHRVYRPKDSRLFFKEGSVFARPSAHSGRWMGCVREQEKIGLPHKVWENGLAFMVNLNWKK